MICVLSFCHLESPVIFKDLINDDILEVETFVREEMLTFLQSKTKFDAHEESMEFYFGPYAHLPNEFKFRIGDKKLIHRMIAQVNAMVNNGDMGISKSNQKESRDESSPNKKNQQMSADAAQTYYFLRKLNDAADRNASRERGGYRFSDETKQFATYIRIIAGPLAYETLQRNLKCALPALVSVNRYIRKSKSKIIEAVPRIEELLVYLTSRNLPLKVSISEDATRIIGRVQYDSITNQLMGFVLPMNKSNGMPIPFSFPAKNAESILSHFSKQNSTSQFMNVVMVQPLANAPPFGLMVYGTDNKQSTNDIITRWLHLQKKMKEKNIDVLTISTDSDPKYNAAMRFLSKLGSSSNFLNSPWFRCGNMDNEMPFFVQDTVHVGTKLRNFLLRTVLNKKVIPFGNCFIKMQHLVYLLANFPKDRHELTGTILNPVDRQNFASVKRMCDTKVINLLRSEVFGGEGTALFLEMVKNIIDSYIDTTLAPLDRVRKMWYSLFIIRIWKEFVTKSKNYTVKDNFLTMNCYACIELNAHALIQIMCHLRDNEIESLFLPHLFSSQQCESTFRLLRSLTSTYSTVTNFTVKEAINRIDKIELQNQIMHVMPEFTYPRLGKKDFANNQQQKLPTTTEISNVILQCQRDAIKTAIKFKLISSRTTEATKRKTTACHINEYIPKKTNNSKAVPHSQAIPMKQLAVSDLKNIALKNYAEKKANPITETSPYIELCFDSKRIVVKKTSLCWLLRPDDGPKLSNDRLLRVRASNISKENKQKFNSKKEYTVNANKVKYTLPKRRCKY